MIGFLEVFLVQFRVAASENNESRDGMDGLGVLGIGWVLC